MEQMHLENFSEPSDAYTHVRTGQDGFRSRKYKRIFAVDRVRSHRNRTRKHAESKSLPNIASMPPQHELASIFCFGPESGRGAEPLRGQLSAPELLATPVVPTQASTASLLCNTGPRPTNVGTLPPLSSLNFLTIRDNRKENCNPILLYRVRPKR